MEYEAGVLWPPIAVLGCGDPHWGWQPVGERSTVTTHSRAHPFVPLISVSPV